MPWGDSVGKTGGGRFSYAVRAEPAPHQNTFIVTRPAASHLRIEVRLTELSQLFNSMDPSPFLEKDLDADAEDFIVGWAQDLPRERPLEIVISLARAPEGAARGPLSGEAELQHQLTEALHNYFAHKAEHARREFSQLMRRGRISLTIGLLFLAGCLVASRVFFSDDRPATFFFRESLIIVGWVAMWRPLEIFLYDWWPIRANVRLYRRLAAAKVSVRMPDAVAATAPAGSA